MTRAIFLSMFVSFHLLQSCSPVYHQTPGFNDEYAELEVTPAMKQDFNDALASLKSVEDVVQSHVGFASEGQLQSSSTFALSSLQNLQCQFKTHENSKSSLSENIAYYVQSETNCPWHILYLVEFSYDVFNAKALVHVKIEVNPRPNTVLKAQDLVMGSALKTLALSGGGEFRFQGSGDETRVLGRYRFEGELETVGGRKSNLVFENDVDATEIRNATEKGTLTHRLYVSSGKNKVGLRSMTQIESHARSTNGFLNKEAAASPDIEKWLANLGLLSPRALSRLGREFSRQR